MNTRKRLLASSSTLALVGVLVSGWMVYSRSGGDEHASHEDTVQIRALAFEFFNAVGSGNSQLVSDKSCDGGPYDDPEAAISATLRGMKVLGVDETLKASKPVTKGSVFFNYEQKNAEAIEPSDREIRSQLVTFKYADGAWCVWG